MVASKTFLSSLASISFGSSDDSGLANSRRATAVTASGSASLKLGTASYLLLLGLLVTLFVNGHCASLEMAPKPATSETTYSDQSKEQDQLSNLVKRSAPALSSGYGHSIMRFGRAPHNIMHFGKRSSSNFGDLADSYSEGGSSSGAIQDLDTSVEAALSTVPDWLIASMLKNHQTKFFVMPVPIPVATGNSGMANAAYWANKGIPVKKAKLSEESDNVFMHFG